MHPSTLLRDGSDRHIQRLVSIIAWLGVCSATACGKPCSTTERPTAGEAGPEAALPADAAEAVDAPRDASADSPPDSCARDPYLPNHYVAPCEQPVAQPSCFNGWCVIEPGCFIMGAPWCEWGRPKWFTDPVQVTLTHRFALQQNELTQGEWIALGLPNPSGLMPNGTGDCIGPDCPVGNITWMEALAFANLLSAGEGLQACYELEECSGQLGMGLQCNVARAAGPSIYECEGYRLPTSAEWEYAARAGTKTSVYAGEVVEHAQKYECFDDPILSPIAWYCANAGTTTQPVGLKLPNAWGLHDTIGNAVEWVTSNGIHGYGDGPYVDCFSSFSFEGILSSADIELLARGGGFNMWPNTLRASAVFVLSGPAKGPSGGVRLARALPPSAPQNRSPAAWQRGVIPP